MNLSTMEKMCFSTVRIETNDTNGNNYSGTGLLTPCPSPFAHIYANEAYGYTHSSETPDSPFM